MDKQTILQKFDNYILLSFSDNKEDTLESLRDYWDINEYLTAEERMLLSVAKVKVSSEYSKELREQFDKLSKAIRLDLEKRLSNQ